MRKSGPGGQAERAFTQGSVLRPGDITVSVLDPLQQTAIDFRV